MREGMRLIKHTEEPDLKTKRKRIMSGKQRPQNHLFNESNDSIIGLSQQEPAI
jgi:hypothetical protein